jgi:endonuclease/exonuclease/phosphatase family metal-dependent hydrolase
MGRRAESRATSRGVPWGLLVTSLYVAFVIAVVATTSSWGDEWWLATVMMFAPRWVYAVPLLLLVPVGALSRHRVWSLGALLASAMLLARFNDVHVPPGGVPPGRARGGLRVMTYNIGGGRFAPSALVELVAELDVDVVGLEECPELDEEAFAAKGYTLRRDSGLCLLARLPIRAADVRDPADVLAASGSGAINRYELEWSGHPFSLQLVHLETVREGLEEAMEGRFWKADWEGPRRMRDVIDERAMESRVAFDWTRRAGANVPSIVMGDFNMPVDSAIYRTYWSSFHNALSEHGRGHLVTKATRWHGLRIDHVLYSSGWTCRSAWIARDLGMDHRPVVADLEWSDSVDTP